jgi:hypothetical protein
MNCRRADQLFSAAWEDELTLVERETLESHIAACAACRVAYDEFVRVMEAVQGLPKVEAGPEFVEGVWGRIRAAEAPKARRRLAWSWNVLQPAFAAAACLVVVGAAVVYWEHNNSVRLGANPSPVAEHQRQAPSPVAAAPAQPKIETKTAPAKLAKRVEPKKAPAEQVADAQRKDEPANGAPAPASQELHQRGVRAEGLAFGRPVLSAQGLVAAKQDSTPPADSLFDHSYDVEFALDPVRLSKSAKGKLSPSRPMPTEVQGKPAKVTF